MVDYTTDSATKTLIEGVYASLMVYLRLTGVDPAVMEFLSRATSSMSLVSTSLCVYREVGFVGLRKR